MEQISLYLAKFACLIPKESVVRECLAEILTRHIGVSIPPELIYLRGSTVFIDASPMIKNILFMNKENVLKELREKLVKISVRDVR